MMEQKTNKMKVVLVVSDPWEFEDENGTSTVAAQLEHSDDVGALLYVPVGVIVNGTRFEYLLCEVRHEGTTMSVLHQSGSVHCNAKVVPADRLSEARALNSGWWRGMGGLIGTLRKNGST